MFMAAISSQCRCVLEWLAQKENPMKKTSSQGLRFNQVETRAAQAKRVEERLGATTGASKGSPPPEEWKITPVIKKGGKVVGIKAKLRF